VRIVFAGTPDAAVPTLRALASGPHDIALVVTRPDAPVGRKRVLTPSPVAVAAGELGLPVLTTARLDEAAARRILDADAALGVIVAYGGLVREPLLSALPHGWINLHFSLLPRWRGAAPVQRALIAGDRVTGAAVFRLVPELDAGDVYRSLERPVDDGETAGDLLAALARDGAGLVTRVVDDIASGSATAIPQQGRPTAAPKLTIDDAHLDLTESVDVVLARFRGVTPEPGAFVTVGAQHVKVLEATAFDGATEHDPALAPGELRLQGGRALAGTGSTPIELRIVQPAGRRPMAAADWMRGLPRDAVARVGAEVVS
jgi:methionyl-tRNA formyltransferase